MISLPRKRVVEWIQSGRQIGRRWQIPVGDDVLWCAVAVQKVGDIYHVYVDEILESQMVAEKYERDEELKFESLTEATDYIECSTRTELEILRPLKGRRIFRPEGER